MVSGGSILVIEDEQMLQDVLAKILELRGYQVICAGSARAAEKILAEREFQLILLDLGLPDCRGIDFAAKMGKDRHTPIMVISGDPDLPDLELPEGVIARACKPFNYADLLHSIERI